VIFQNISNEKSYFHKQYINANLRLEELINIVVDYTPFDSPSAKEFQGISDIIEEYELRHFPWKTPNCKNKYYSINHRKRKCSPIFKYSIKRRVSKNG